MKQVIKFSVFLWTVSVIIMNLWQCRSVTDTVLPNELIDSLAQKAIMVLVSQKRDSLDSLLRSQTLLPTTAPYPPTTVDTATTIVTTVDSTVSCTVQKYKWAAGDENAILLDPTPEVIYPGALIDPSSIDDGRYTPFLWGRSSMVVSMSSFNAPRSADTITDPSKKSSAQEAISRLLSQTLKGKIPAKMTSEVIKIYSKEQAAVAVGADFNSGSFKVAGKFKWDNTKIRQRFMVKFYQEFCNVSVDLPIRPVDLFKGQLNMKLLGQYSPALISNVKYGRICLFLFETESADESIEASLNASYSALTAGGSVSADLKLHAVMEKSQVQVLAFGGDPTLAAQVKDPETLQNFITNSAEFTPSSQPVMIGYTLRSIKDNSILRIVKATEYEVRNCKTEVSQYLDLTLKGVSLIGLHNGDCYKAWGTVDVEVWETKDGILVKRILPLTENGIIEPVSQMMNWANNGNVSPIAEYNDPRGYAAITNVNKTWTFKLNPKKVNTNEVVFMVKTFLGSQHKWRDVSLDYTSNAGMAGPETNRISVLDVINAKKSDPISYNIKDGPMITGPFTSPFRNDHHFRAHFDIKVH